MKKPSKSIARMRPVVPTIFDDEPTRVMSLDELNVMLSIDGALALGCRFDVHPSGSFPKVGVK